MEQNVNFGKKGESKMSNKIIKKISFNLLWLIILPLAIYCGITSKADWWIIVLILLSSMELTITWRRT